MARRRFQQPTLRPRGQWWVIDIRIDVFENGKYRRKHTIKRIAPLTMNQREAQKVLSEYLRPMNQGLEAVGSATNFQHYVENTYLTVSLPLLASTTQNRYRGVINNYLLPAFGKQCLRDLKPAALQAYFTGLIKSPLSHESKDKIRDVMSAILKTAVTYELLIANPMEKVRIPPEKRGKKRNKPNITFEEFEQILAHMAEPYATMVYVAVYSGLRISELIGLRWDDVWQSELNVDERCCRGDWSQPKSEASNAPVGVQRHVIERIHRLKLLTVEGKCGRAVRKYKLVKSVSPEDLVFQSVREGKPMRDNNILVRHIKPAARAIGLGFVNWRCLRTSYGTWLKKEGADMKDIQRQMRHSRISTTMDIYVQDIPESRRQAVDKLPVPTRVN